MKKQFTSILRHFSSLVTREVSNDATQGTSVSDAKPSLKSRLSKHLLTSAAAVALAAGGASDAKGSVVYWNYNRAIGATVDGLYVNVETGVTYDSANANVVFPGWDINPYGTSSSAISFFWSQSSNGASAGVRLNTVAGGTTSGTTIASLPPGFVVGAQLVGGTSGASFGTGSANFTTTNQGKWNYNSDNYFGFRFTASDGQIHYGWGRISVGANALTRTMLSVAYETVAGQSIVVGGGDPSPPCTNPTLSAITTATTCAGQSNGSIDLTASGGSPTPLTYSWTVAGSVTVIATTEDISGKAAGNYVVKAMTASGGCYTIGNYTIAAGPAVTNNTSTASACDSYTWSLNGQTYTQSGSYTSATTCGSEILNLTITPSTTNTTTVTQASSYTWSVNSQTYTQSGTYSSVSGCATEILNLTISGGGCTQTPQPSIACYETATWDSINCQWNITGTAPTQPTTACYETATFDSTTCSWIVTGTQPAQPSIACYETATFNNTTCSWDVTGTQPTQPSIACYQTATFDTSSCAWVVTGTQPAQPGTAVDINVTFTGNCGSISGTYVNSGLLNGYYDFQLVTNGFTYHISYSGTEWVLWVFDYTNNGFMSSSSTSNGLYPPSTGWVPTQCFDGTLSWNYASPLLACYQTATFNGTTCQWDITGTQPSQPSLACYESATFNGTTCQWDVTGTQPSQPSIACYETATFNNTTCSWDVTGTQPSQPTLACYESATFNGTTCQWDVTGTQPSQPTLACYESATFNSTTCQWDVTGTQPSQPTLACYESATFNGTTCQWDVTGTQPSQPTLACYESATFNSTTCQWDVTGTKPSQPSIACYETATWNGTTCQWDVTGTQPPQPNTAVDINVTFSGQCGFLSGTFVNSGMLNGYYDFQYNSGSYTYHISYSGTAWVLWVVDYTNNGFISSTNTSNGLYPPTTGWVPTQCYDGTLSWNYAATPLACYETSTWNSTTCSWDISGTQPAQPSIACYETATFNTNTCSWDVTGTQPTQPSIACYETATFNGTTCQWDVTGTQPAAPTGLACYETATFNGTTCQWDVTGSPLTAAASTSGIACNSSTSTITVTASGGNLPYTGTGTFSLTSGNHTFIVSDAGGCTATAIVSNRDSIAPTITGVPSNFTATISCSGPVSWTPPSAADNCSVTSFTSTKSPGDVFPVGTTTVVYTAVDAEGNSTSASFTVTVVSFAISISGTNISCYGNSDGTATVNTINTQGPVSYLWSTGATTSSLSNLTAGSYTVIVTNGSCTQNGFIVITQPSQLNANVNKTDVTCNGGSNGSITISSPVGGSGNYEYSINGGSSWQLSGSYTGLTAGSYAVQIRDAYNRSCSRSLNTVTVSQPSAFTVSINASPSTTVCQGTTVQLCASLSVSSTGFTYLWSNSATTSCINISNIGTSSYTVRATNSAGCSATSSAVSVTVNPSVAASVSISSNISGPVSPSSSITFVATPVNGGSSPVYAWKRNGTAVGTNSSSYTGTAWTTGETVQCTMTSNAPCASGSPASSNTITITVSNSQPKFIISDVTANRVFYYDSSFAYIQSSPLSTTVLNGTTNAEDVYATATNVYILDGTNKKVYRTSSSGAVSTSSRQLRSTAGQGLNPLTGIVIIGNHLLVVDKNSKAIYRYDLTAAFSGTTNYNALQKIDLNTQNSNAEALSYDPVTNAFYVLDNSTTKAFFRYPITSLTSTGITIGASTRSRPMRTNTGLALSQVTGSVVDNTSIRVTDRGLDRALTYKISDLFTGSNTVNLNALAMATLNAQNLNSTGISIVTTTTLARSVADGTPTQELNEQADRLQMMVYPNPATYMVTLSLSGISEASSGNLMIVDMSGRKVFETVTATGSSSYQQEIGLESFAKGLYMVVFTQGDERKVMRLIVQ